MDWLRENNKLMNKHKFKFDPMAHGSGKVIIGEGSGIPVDPIIALASIQEASLKILNSIKEHSIKEQNIEDAAKLIQAIASQQLAILGLKII